jgi:hypothetical protein
MNTPSDAELSPPVDVKNHQDSTASPSVQSASREPRQPRKPYLDADPNDIVPGYSDADAWYEP